MTCFGDVGYIAMPTGSFLTQSGIHAVGRLLPSATARPMTIPPATGGTSLARERQPTPGGKHGQQPTPYEARRRRRKAEVKGREGEGAGEREGRQIHERPPEWWEQAMSDTPRGTSQDRKLIALAQDYEVRDWCKSLGCTETELRAAVAAVGNSAEKVREYLKARGGKT